MKTSSDWNRKWNNGGKLKEVTKGIQVYWEKREIWDRVGPEKG
jgi:hypothetical protein